MQLCLYVIGSSISEDGLLKYDNNMALILTTSNKKSQAGLNMC